MEDNAIRTIIIAVSIFVTLLVFSLVMNYYNAAKSTIEGLPTDMVIENYYSDDINRILTEDKDKNSTNGIQITGSQLKNLINYYYGSSKVMILVSKSICGGTHDYYNANRFVNETYNADSSVPNSQKNSNYISNFKRFYDTKLIPTKTYTLNIDVNANNEFNDAYGVTIYKVR